MVHCRKGRPYARRDTGKEFSPTGGVARVARCPRSTRGCLAEYPADHTAIIGVIVPASGQHRHSFGEGYRAGNEDHRRCDRCTCVPTRQRFRFPAGRSRSAGGSGRMAGEVTSRVWPDDGPPVGLPAQRSVPAVRRSGPRSWPPGSVDIPRGGRLGLPSQVEFQPRPLNDHHGLRGGVSAHAGRTYVGHSCPRPMLADRIRCRGQRPLDR
jgi:hypothetical protein